MSPVALQLARFLAVFAISTSCGGHWIVLQSVAWSRMIVEYAQTAPLERAIGNTFDGQHPCSLCKKIATAKKSEKHHDTQPVVSQMTLFHERAAALVPPVRAAQPLFVSLQILRSRSGRPLLRPPRGAFLA